MLLVALHKAGINNFTATRLETGARPADYPVFIRAEDGYGGPETELLGNDAEFDAAVDGPDEAWFAAARAHRHWLCE